MDLTTHAGRVAALRARLAARPLLLDGAMGTQLQRLGLELGRSGEGWNRSRPEAVRSIHAAYVTAGSDAVTTNTFMATALALASHGLQGDARALNEAGARLAREAAGDRAFVLGDMGPFGGFLEPIGEVSEDAALATFRDQAAALLAGGADGMLVETMSDPREAALAVRGAREAGAELVFATFAFGRTAEGFRTMMGSSVEDALAAVVEAGADAVGANCGTELSLTAYADLVGELVAQARGKPVIAQPNAGTPALEQGQAVYAVTPDLFASALVDLVSRGARLVGGCCGTSPAHLAAAADALRARRPA